MTPPPQRQRPRGLTGEPWPRASPHSSISTRAWCSACAACSCATTTGGGRRAADLRVRVPEHASRERASRRRPVARRDRPERMPGPDSQAHPGAARARQRARGGARRPRRPRRADRPTRRARRPDRGDRRAPRTPAGSGRPARLPRPLLRGSRLDALGLGPVVESLLFRARRRLRTPWQTVPRYAAGLIALPLAIRGAFSRDLPDLDSAGVAGIAVLRQPRLRVWPRRSSRSRSRRRLQPP